MKKNTISKFQLFFFLIQSEVGIGILSLPNVVHSSAKGNGWISSILASLIVQLILIIYWSIFKRFPNDSYTEVTKRIFGSIIGNGMNSIIYLHFILSGSFFLVVFVNIINVWLLPLTPLWVVSTLIMIASIYLTINNLRVIARFFVLASFLLLFLFFLSLLTFSIPKEFNFILPIGNSGMKNILLGSHNSLISMLGFEGILFILPCILSKEKGVFKTISFANIIISALYTYIIFLCLVSFTPAQLDQIKEPTLYLFRGLSFRMVDRIDLIFLSIWIVPMTTSLIAYIFLATKSISIDDKNYKRNVIISAIIIWIISFFPFDQNSLNIYSKYVNYFSYIIVIVLPIILLCTSIIINKKEMSENT